MRSYILHALLSLFFTSLCAAEPITITAKFFESKKGAIPHDQAKAATTKGLEIMTVPSAITKSGRQIKIEHIRDHQPASVAPSAFQPIPVGVTVCVTPHLDGDKIAFTARLSVSRLIANKPPKGQTLTEVSSRDLYVSGIAKNNEEFWFDLLDSNSEKKMTVLLQLTVK